MLNVTEVLVEEWLRNPVTEILGQMLDERLEFLTQARAAIYYPGEPQKTQENICACEAQIDSTVVLQTLLDKETFLAEVEDLERVQRDKA